MTGRRRYVVMYDIVADKRRNKVYKTLLGFGNRVQYSVFICRLDGKELAELTGLLETRIHSREDQILLVDTGPASRDEDDIIQSIGKDFTPVERLFIV